MTNIRTKRRPKTNAPCWVFRSTLSGLTADVNSENSEYRLSRSPQSLVPYRGADTYEGTRCGTRIERMGRVHLQSVRRRQSAQGRGTHPGGGYVRLVRLQRAHSRHRA